MWREGRVKERESLLEYREREERKEEERSWKKGRLNRRESLLEYREKEERKEEERSWKEESEVVLLWRKGE